MGESKHSRGMEILFRRVFFQPGFTQLSGGGSWFVCVCVLIRFKPIGKWFTDDQT